MSQYGNHTFGGDQDGSYGKGSYNHQGFGGYNQPPPPPPGGNRRVFDEPVWEEGRNPIKQKGRQSESEEDKRASVEIQEKSRSRSRSVDRGSGRSRRRSRSKTRSRSRSNSRSSLRRRSKSSGRRSKSRSRRSPSRRRRRRDRSRSRSRSRSRNRRRRSRSRGRRGRSRSRSRDRRKSRSRSQRRSWRDGKDNWNQGGSGGGMVSDEPNNTVMIRGLPVYILEQDIIDNILTHGIEAKEVRLIRKKDTGESRGFAFVEFAEVDEATEWIDAEQGMLQFGTWQITMQYSQARQEMERVEPSKLLVDWKCTKCDVQNFKRRDYCFKCGNKRPEIDLSNTILEEEQDESSPHPSSVLLLTNLDALTVEDTIYNILSKISKHPIKSVNIARDRLTNMSRGVCYVEMKSVMDAMLLFKNLQEDSISIEGKKLIVAYKRQDPNQIKEKDEIEVVELDAAEAPAQEQGGTSNFSVEEIRKMAEYSADLYAKHPAERHSYIQYYEKYYREGGDPTPALKAIYGEKKKVPESLGTVTVEGVVYQKYPTPNTSTYQFDESSGYYFDPLSTLYYDANSQYYYNSKTSSFCYWDAAHSTFLPAPASANKEKAAAVEDSKKEKVKDKDKVKTAKKIQKDMEKWAKTLNQKKNLPILQIKETPAPPEPTGIPLQKGVEDIAFSILQRKEEKPVVMESLNGLSGYGSDEEAGDIKAQEMALTDWDKYACLLCKRQFQTQEKLMKHNTVSDLHKQNLDDWRKTQIESRLSGGSLEATLQYRDRAKERRSKFGDDDNPPPNRYKEKYMKVMDNIAASSVPDTAEMEIGGDNVGNKMLQKMGWKQGLGLGKSNQGRTDIISTDDGRTNSAGLGIKQVARRSNDDYRQAAKRTLWSRFNDR